MRCEHYRYRANYRAELCAFHSNVALRSAAAILGASKIRMHLVVTAELGLFALGQRPALNNEMSQQTALAMGQKTLAGINFSVSAPALAFTPLH